MRPEGFIVSVKKAVIRALRAGIDADLAADDPLRKVSGNIDMEYPDEAVKYPGIWVQFSFKKLQKTGVSDLFVNDDGREFQLWQFEGTITLNIVALSSKERDRISESFVEMFAFGSIDGPRQDFWENFNKSDVIFMSADKDQLRPGGQGVNIGAPWNPEVLVYEDAYSFDVMGQFASDIQTAELVVLRRIDVIPEMVIKAGEWV